MLVEHSEGAVKKVTTESTAARHLGEPSAVVVGAPAPPHRWSRTWLPAGHIYVAESDDAEKYLITPYVDVRWRSSSSRPPLAVLLPATADGKGDRGPVGRRGSVLACSR